MNRIIKFRAWDKVSEKMYDTGFHIEPLGTIVMHNFYWDKKPDLVLMQFTGLLDKNGREIFESDFVREWIVDEHPSDLIYCVGFSDGHFTLTDIKSGYDRMGIWNVHKNMEIIGNIYESPELIPKVST